MDNIELTKRLRALHAADLGALIVAFPEAGPYVSANAPAEKANELVLWAEKAGRREELIRALARVEGKSGTQKGGVGVGGTIPRDDVPWFEMANAEAAKCRSEPGHVSPKVGCVVIRDGRMLARGYRGELKPGEHAEYTVLDRKLADQPLHGVTVYTTLEPCTHRSPEKTPCAERLVQARVARVVIGMVDPDPRITGKGILILRDAGIRVDLFPKEYAETAESLNREFVRDRKRRAKEAGQSTGEPPPGSGQKQAGKSEDGKGSSAPGINIKVRGGAVAIGKKAVAAGKGGLAIGGDVHGNIVIGKG
jgi:pyrimidine deaminase RibD-like protein